MRLHHRVVSVHLARPFVSNAGVTTQVRQSVVEVGWRGLTGHGTARGADPDAVDACAEVLRAAATPYELRRVMGLLTAEGIEPAARSAVDMALHDLLGKACGQPLHHLLGLAGLPVPPTAVSIGACTDGELAAAGRSLAHWPVLKLKYTPDDDGSRVRVLRSVYDGRIRVDGNGSWEPEQAVRVAHELGRYGVEMLEQPVPPGEVDALRYVSDRAPLPVYADEDCHGPDDVQRLRGQVAGINIKLVKCGGLLAARETIDLARRAGLAVMLGCKLESSLGVTAMAQLAGLADHLDLDGHVGLVDDPFTGADVTAGVVTLPPGPGLGVTANQMNDGEE
ncbi:dipeptide epimerase [Streptomyces alboniger]|uniref:Dipeptide epimerase n=1 Tax=Streptomyces alboniger TaxID=132473 RepID=A0A5J6HFE1_STRAD|nr:dipeptide epimerase [Streptomyces alboniger]QEV17962.1 dipeptide epimerase [Streptomyces alboniger]